MKTLHEECEEIEKRYFNKIFEEFEKTQKIQEERWALEKYWSDAFYPYFGKVKITIRRKKDGII